MNPYIDSKPFIFTQAVFDSVSHLFDPDYWVNNVNDEFDEYDHWINRPITLVILYYWINAYNSNPVSIERLASILTLSHLGNISSDKRMRRMYRSYEYRERYREVLEEEYREQREDSDDTTPDFSDCEYDDPTDSSDTEYSDDNIIVSFCGCHP